MPLYDYICAACGEAASLLVGLNREPPPCPSCAATALTKQLSPFAIGGASGRPTAKAPAAEPAKKTGCASPGHVHGSGCRSASSGQAKPSASCNPYTDSIVKKYLGD